MTTDSSLGAFGRFAVVSSICCACSRFGNPAAFAMCGIFRRSMSPMIVPHASHHGTLIEERAPQPTPVI